MIKKIEKMSKSELIERIRILQKKSELWAERYRSLRRKRHAIRINIRSAATRRSSQAIRAANRAIKPANAPEAPIAHQSHQPS